MKQVRKWGLRLVVDPVMVAKSGASLLKPDAVAVLRSQLLPLAEVVTPNIPEAEVLIGQRIETLGDMRAAASTIFGMGARHVVVKGGHRGQVQRGRRKALPLRNLSIFILMGNVSLSYGRNVSRRYIRMVQAVRSLPL